MTGRAFLALLGSYRLRLPVACIGAGLWVASLILPALSMEFDPANGQIVLAGHKVLTMGFVAIVWGQFGWLANIVLFGVLVGLTSFSVSQRFMRWSAIALIALSLGTLDLMIRYEFHGRPQFLPGYYVWMAGNLFVAGIAIIVSSRKHAMAE